MTECSCLALKLQISILEWYLQIFSEKKRNERKMMVLQG